MTAAIDSADSARRGRQWGYLSIASGGCALVVACVFARWPSNPQLVVAVGATAVVTAALGLRLPRGDVVRVDALAASGALVLLPPAEGISALLAGCIVGMLLARRVTQSTVRSILIDASRHATALGLAYIAAIVGGEVFHLADIVVAGAAVSTYVLFEMGSFIQQRAFVTRTSYLLVGTSILRSLWQIYLGQACLGVALAVVYPTMGLWSIPVMTVLGAILLNGFALYLRVKIAYQETISALAKVSELHLSGRRGHAQQVANMSLAVGRQLGLSAHHLEALNYAALLHEIGLLDRDVDVTVLNDEVDQWASKGAGILGTVPVLADAAGMVSCQSPEAKSTNPPTAQVSLGGSIIRACCLVEEGMRDVPAGLSSEILRNLLSTIESKNSWIPSEVLSAAASAPREILSSDGL